MTWFQATKVQKIFKLSVLGTCHKNTKLNNKFVVKSQPANIHPEAMIKVEVYGNLLFYFPIWTVSRMGWYSTSADFFYFSWASKCRFIHSLLFLFPDQICDTLMFHYTINWQYHFLQISNFQFKVGFACFSLDLSIYTILRVLTYFLFYFAARFFSKLFSSFFLTFSYLGVF